MLARGKRILITTNGPLRPAVCACPHTHSSRIIIIIFLFSRVSLFFLDVTRCSLSHDDKIHEWVTSDYFRLNFDLKYLLLAKVLQFIILDTVL